MIIYNNLCYDLKRRLEFLPLMEGSPVFESCRLATIVFTDVALLRDYSNTEMLAAGIRAAVEASETMNVLPEVTDLMLWILFMGTIAAMTTHNNTWFKASFARALSLRTLHHFETVKRALIEFLYLEAVFDQPLKEMWADVESLIEF